MCSSQLLRQAFTIRSTNVAADLVQSAASNARRTLAASSTLLSLRLKRPQHGLLNEDGVFNLWRRDDGADW